MQKTFTAETLPYKITLIDKYGNKHDYWKSTTEELQYNTETFKRIVKLTKDSEPITYERIRH